MKKVAVVTGTGTGVGRAVAMALAQEQWQIALVGRRQNTLEETRRLCQRADLLICPCDIGDLESVQTMARTVVAQLGPVEVLVNAAGANVPKRSLEMLSIEDYHELINTNLHGPYYCAQAFLPAMRQQKSGTIVNIGSEAGLQASPKSGPGYVMSKFGLRGLTQSINAEERAHGIRACYISPGDIDTPLLEKRPVPPPPEARQKMLQAEDVAECAMLVIDLPARAMVEEIVIRPR